MVNDKINIDFFLIGAQKCATSWMFLCLKEHPEITVPLEKEIGFIGGELFNEKGEEWFYNRFINKPSTKIIGDVSVEYMYNLHTAALIKKHSTNPKFIVSLRHPVDRLISSYYWLIRVGKLPNLPIEDAIDSILMQPIGFPNKIDGPLEEVVRRSCYHYQLENYINQFSHKDFLVVLYEDIRGNEQDVINKVYNFLEVNPFSPPSLKQQQLKNTYNNTSLKIENKLNRKSIFGRIIAKLAILANMKLLKEVPKNKILSQEKRDKLFQLFEPEIEKTKEILLTIPESNRPSNRKIIDKMWLNNK